MPEVIMRALTLRCPACSGAWELPSSASEPGKSRSGRPADGHEEASAAVTLRCLHCAHELEHRGGILELDERPGVPEYPAELSASDAALDGDHWWYASRNAVILQTLRAWQRARGRAGLAFDLGCGSGYVLAALEAQGWRSVGLDMQRAALEVARTRLSGTLLRSGTPRPPLAEPVDLALLCDVLEHADESELLTPLRESLAPDGALLLTVPARPSLWSLEDVAVGHRRRYTPSTLRQTLLEHGFRVRRLRGFHSWLTPLARRAARRAGAPPERAEALRQFLAGRRLPSARASAVCGAMCALENAVGRVLPLPFASHLVALAEPR
ncbi:MAG: hypothetical protein DHS20C15_21800 [Planctomycetota bacterium]|nr:MAG: hypothetical protein DHS20C15_21800 [Planctomycetota bacterium]